MKLSEPFIISCPQEQLRNLYNQKQLCINDDSEIPSKTGFKLYNLISKAF